VHRLCMAEEPASGASQKEVNRQYVGPFFSADSPDNAGLWRIALGRTKLPCPSRQPAHPPPPLMFGGDICGIYLRPSRHPSVHPLLQELGFQAIDVMRLSLLSSTVWHHLVASGVV
jgi:hypothetical protein